jgi:hypothetical protein
MLPKELDTEIPAKPRRYRVKRAINDSCLLPGSALGLVQ